MRSIWDARQTQKNTRTSGYYAYMPVWDPCLKIHKPKIVKQPRCCVRCSENLRGFGDNGKHMLNHVMTSPREIVRTWFLSMSICFMILQASERIHLSKSSASSKPAKASVQELTPVRFISCNNRTLRILLFDCPLSVLPNPLNLQLRNSRFTAGLVHSSSEIP